MRKYVTKGAIDLSDIDRSRVREVVEHLDAATDLLALVADDDDRRVDHLTSRVCDVSFELERALAKGYCQDCCRVKVSGDDERCPKCEAAFAKAAAEGREVME